MGKNVSCVAVEPELETPHLLSNSDTLIVTYNLSSVKADRVAGASWLASLAEIP